MNQRAAPACLNAAAQTGSTVNCHGETPILAVVGDRHLVFNEAHQAIHELSDFAVYVWRSSDTGMSAADMAGELVAAGVDPEEAQGAVTITLEQVRALRAGAPVAMSPSVPAPSERLTRLTVVIADVAVQLYLSKALVADVEAEFGLLITDLPDADMLLSARAAGGSVSFSSPGQPDWSCERSHFIPLLKAQLIESVLACARYEVAMHVAALVREDRTVLLVGSPGAGKTTLAIALERVGLQVMADDVVLLDQAGLITGLSFPFAAKSSSWPLLSRHWPGIADRPSHCRPDGQTLCYIPLDPGDYSRPRRISVIVLLNRQEGAGTCVEALDLVTALGALVAEGATRDERLTSRGFTALVEGLREARCFRLTYSDLVEAADAVRGLPA